MERTPKPTLREDGRWMVRTAAGTSPRYVYGRTAEEAIQNRNRVLARGTLRLRPGSLSEFAVTTFMPWIQGRVKPETVNRYDATWRLQLGPALGHKRFSELTPALIQSAVRVEGTAGPTQLIAKSLLLMMVRLAVATGAADVQVIEMVRLAKTDPRKHKKRRNVEERAALLLQRAEESGHWMEGPIWTAMTLGLRKGEVCGLKRSDLVGNVITLHRQRNHITGEKDWLKHREDGETRRIALPEELMTRLRSYCNGASIYVFTTDAGKPIPYQHLDRPMKDLQSGFEDVLTFHDLRSAAVTRLVHAGVDLLIVQELVGHATVRQVLQYLGESDEQMTAALRKLSSRTTF